MKLIWLLLFFFFSPHSRYSIKVALHETPLKKLNFFSLWCLSNSPPPPAFFSHLNQTCSVFVNSETEGEQKKNVGVSLEWKSFKKRKTSRFFSDFIWELSLMKFNVF